MIVQYRYVLMRVWQFVAILLLCVRRITRADPVRSLQSFGGDAYDQTATKTIRLAQGSPVLVDQFPFAASLAINGVHSCGGLVIQPRVILTAGHCVTNLNDGSLKAPESMQIHVGNVTRGEGKMYPVEQVVIPEIFSVNDTFLGDIALLELSVPLDVEEAILGEVSQNNTILTAIGWGFTTEENVLSTSLLQTLLGKIDSAACDAFHDIKGLGTRPVDHFCAQGINTAADTCRGDSGGPLLQGDFHVVGITSYGASDAKCGQINSTGVYTSVDFWHPWINDTLSLYNMEGLSRPGRLVYPDFNTCWETTREGASVNVVDSVGACANMCRESFVCFSWEWKFQTKECHSSPEMAVPVIVSEDCHTGTVVQNIDKLLMI